MNAVKVEYTVKPEYRETNKKNILRVMEALRLRPIPGMQYATFTDERNPDTFIHINIARDASTMAKLSDVSEFQDFRMALKGSNPVSPPKQTKLNLVGAGFKLT